MSRIPYIVGLLGASFWLSGGSADALTVSAFGTGELVDGKLEEDPDGNRDTDKKKVEVEDTKLFAENSVYHLTANLIATANGVKKEKNTGGIFQKFLVRPNGKTLEINEFGTERPDGTNTVEVISEDRFVKSTAYANYEFDGRISTKRAGGKIEYTFNLQAAVEADGDVVIKKAGKGKKMVFGDYSSKADFTDPIAISSHDLDAAGADLGSFTYLQPFGLETLDFGLNSERRYSVFAETGAVRRTVFSLSRTTGGGLSGYFDPNTVFFGLSSVEEDVDLANKTPLDMAAFLSTLLEDLREDMALSAPFYLSAGINGLAVAEGPESFLRVGYDMFEGERDAKIEFIGVVPLPATFLLMLSGWVMLMVGPFRRRLSRSS